MDVECLSVCRFFGAKTKKRFFSVLWKISLYFIGRWVYSQDAVSGGAAVGTSNGKDFSVGGELKSG